MPTILSDNTRVQQSVINPYVGNLKNQLKPKDIKKMSLPIQATYALSKAINNNKKKRLVVRSNTKPQEPADNTRVQQPINIEHRTDKEQLQHDYPQNAPVSDPITTGINYSLPVIGTVLTAVDFYNGLKDIKNNGFNLNNTTQTFLAGVPFLSKMGAITKPYRIEATKRALETVMRSSGFGTPFPARLELKDIVHTDPSRLIPLAAYTLTGARIGPKGYYNSLNDFTKHPGHHFYNPKGKVRYYTGFSDRPDNDLSFRFLNQNDMVDAFLYNKKICPWYGYERTNIGDNFGIHADYIAQKYADKASDIPVYEGAYRSFLKVRDKPKIIGSDGSNDGFPRINNTQLDAGGHLVEIGDLIGDKVYRYQDIWKFNPEDYLNRWGRRMGLTSSALRKYISYEGLKLVDKLGTPVITRTPWSYIEDMSKLNKLYFP